MNEQTWRKQASVINNDKFDKRRFQKLYDLSQGLQNLNEFEAPFPTYGSLLNDIWGSLYKMKPELKEREDVPKAFQTNHAFMKRIMDDENFERYRETTRLDDLASAIGTVQFGKKTHEWLKQQREHDDSLDEQMQELNAMQRQFERQRQEYGAGNENQNLQEELQHRTEELQEVIEQALNPRNNGFDEAMEQALEATQASKQNLKTLMGGTKAGSGEAELKKVPLRDQLALAEQLTDDARLQQIAEWAGRFKLIARKKQKSKHHQATSRRGVTRGNDPARLLPAELALYKNETTRTEFLRRFAQQRIRQHDTAGKDALGQGPIVLCLDQSGSMASLDTQAKGFTLALMSIAKREKRDFAFIPFSGSAYKYLYKEGKLKSEDMVELCQYFIGGGTNFESALRKGVEVIQQTRFKRADIVFVTDGEARVSDNFLDFFQEQKQKHGFHVLSLLIGTNRHVETFSDKVVEISDFNDKRSFKAFEI
ncbi:VWA domain-containing protein [Lentibacillus sp. CBA3610]|uniref:VWA domain-containing protein n=1 Tax=Lentibacillus sp. CBA3610 TaxID=2518176 RepID=UPI001595AA42|nr:VWA domain-containing protein [Lentibacillus sp. CBA3610]QKY69344.1 VWA domain-containing protein [Lentibacillus sp. CBA3610]